MQKGLTEDEVAARCLKMCIHSLERVTKARSFHSLIRPQACLPVSQTYAENLSLKGIMDEVVIPCTSHEDPDIQRDAVTCIAMCSLITRVFHILLLVAIC